MSDQQSSLLLVREDPYLEPYEKEISRRMERYRSSVSGIVGEYGSLARFASAYTHYGFNRDERRGGWWYREWAPAAFALYLIGDFNGWDRRRHPLTRGDDGVWGVFLPDQPGGRGLTHGSRVKVHIVSANGALDRIPAYIRRVVRDPETKDFAGQIWSPPTPFVWTDQGTPSLPVAQPLIYELHPGISQEKEAVGTYREVADNVLPRVVSGGYNTIQVMAVMEHPYYGSFGYHVSSFYSPSSWFGTPEDLKYLVNDSHRMGLVVIMDVVHSHAVKNLYEGLNDFDGSRDQFFHPGERGNHPQWDSKLFDYSKREVQRFLLSNLRYWIEEFHFDGFRFDGVTSMLYTHHGLNAHFDHYDKYFYSGIDDDAITYLQMANDLVHALKPGALTVAEDMSGMPGMARSISDGGIGFDYRLGMGIPDYWIKLLKHVPDEAWDLHELWSVLNDRRYREKTIAYAESHDQALVGDKTIAFWLMDKEMYDRMDVDSRSVVIDRGIALHKLIRLVTISLGGEGYLNFMGNEFGHPEWIDFPREGNNWSFRHARRQWSLVDNALLRYRHLAAFDRAMVRTIEENGVLAAPPARLINMDTENRMVVYERGPLIFVVSFHPDRSIFDYRFWVPEPGDYRIVLNSDAREFGGFGRVDDSHVYTTQRQPEGWDRLSVYATNRTALALKRVG